MIHTRAVLKIEAHAREMIAKEICKVTGSECSHYRIYIYICFCSSLSFAISNRTWQHCWRSWTLCLCTDIQDFLLDVAWVIPCSKWWILRCARTAIPEPLAVLWVADNQSFPAALLLVLDEGMLHSMQSLLSPVVLKQMATGNQASHLGGSGDCSECCGAETEHLCQMKWRLNQAPTICMQIHSLEKSTSIARRLRCKQVLVTIRHIHTMILCWLRSFQSQMQISAAKRLSTWWLITTSVIVMCVPSRLRTFYVYPKPHSSMFDYPTITWLLSCHGNIDYHHLNMDSCQLNIESSCLLERKQRSLHANVIS